MNLYLVTYDLSKPEGLGDYYLLHEHLKTYEAWARPLQSVWIIKTYSSKDDVLNNVLRYVDGNDKVLVVGLDKNWASFHLTDKIVNWLRQNLSW